MEGMMHGNIIKADLDKPLIRLDVGTVMASGDEKANRFGAQLHRSGVDADASSCSVVGYLIRPNDETLRIEGTASGNTVYVDIPDHGYVYDGAFTLTVKVYGDGYETAIVIFDGKIAKSTTDSIIDSDRELYGVDEILTLIEAMEQAEADANAAAQKANVAASRAPYVGVNGNWYVWDTSIGKYKDSTTKATGNDGITPQVDATVTTGEPGTQASVSVSGTKENPVFDFTIPRGDTGAVDGIDYYAGAPSPLGTASPGTANGVARGDHVHPFPIIMSDVMPETPWPVLWFNTDPFGENAAVATMLLEEDETGSEVQVEVDGEDYGVTNTALNDDPETSSEYGVTTE